MNKIYIVCFVMLALFHSMFAQQAELKGKAEISGLIIDQSLNEPLPFVTIALKSKSDRRILGGQISNESGHFTLNNLPIGEYILEFQFIGYQSIEREVVISKRNEKLTLGNINLEEEATQLDGVEVVAERSTLEQRIDRKVINIMPGHLSINDGIR